MCVPLSPPAPQAIALHVHIIIIVSPPSPLLRLLHADELHLIVPPPLSSGYGMQMSCFLFISRKWESDRLEFQKKLYYFNVMRYPIQLLLFPEGGDLTPKTRQRSNTFADANQLPRVQYCFHPRTTGFSYAVNAMRDGGLDAVYDLTIAYPDVLPKTELDAWNGIYPREVHFYVRKFDNVDVPQEQGELKKWLQDRWLEKEERLKDFYTHKRFKESEVTNHDMDTKRDSPEVVKPKNILFLLYSIFVISSTNLIIFTLWALVPYFTVYFLFSSVFVVYRGCKDHHQFQTEGGGEGTATSQQAQLCQW